MAAIGGMIGHGLRYLAVEAGWRLEVATFFGALVVGLVAASIARRYKLPFAVIAFAGAVTMMPGIQIYQTLGGIIRLAKLKGSSELTMVTHTLGNASQASLVIIALTLGITVAARVVLPRDHA
jgi:uncharacterized membrane protein YjjB (DUF3815 family)